MKIFPQFRKRNKERGQVLILAVFAVIILITVLLVLFDVQQVIRRKVKVMSAIDAAALTGAVWQKNSLNLIGELNLIKSCTVLISDSIYGVGGNPNDFMRANITQQSSPEEIDRAVRQAHSDLAKLKQSADMLTEMQVRVCFTGPLIGFGAAQQAAKNNGLPSNDSCNNYMRDLYDMVMDPDVYGNPELAPQVYHGYAWREPYGRMLYSLLGSRGKGLAVGTNIKHIGMPGLISDTMQGNSLDEKFVLEAIEANDWCILQKLVDADLSYSGKWWGNLRIMKNEKFLGGSEILPLHVTYNTGEQVYDLPDKEGFLDRLIAQRSKTGVSLEKLSSAYNRTNLVKEDGSVNWADTDLSINPLPSITWGVFDEYQWCSYDRAGVDMNYWYRYLRSRFKPGYDYHSGAVSYFSVQVPNDSMMKRMDLFGRGVMQGGSQNSSSLGGKMTYYARRAAAYQRSTSQTSIRFNATAKPFGTLVGSDNVARHPFAGGMVLPVFKEVALIPVALEHADGYPMEDYAWIIYLTKYLPALGTVDHRDELADGEKLDPKYYRIVKDAGYISLLEKLEDPAWRAEGRRWLESEATGHDIFDAAGRKIGHVTDTVNKDHCNDWRSGSGPGSFRDGPGVLH